MSSRLFVPVLVALLATALWSGCARDRSPLAPPNRPPVVRFVDAPGRAARGTPYVLRWEGSDPDGRVDHYLVAHGSAAAQPSGAGWTRSAETAWALPARGAGSLGARPAGETTEPFDLIAVRAVDDRGAMSEPIVRAMFGDNVAPSVRITCPRENSLLNPPSVPSTFRIRWEGVDPDGAGGRPAYYKYKLFRCVASEFSCSVLLSNPDSLRRFYAPAFAGWDSVGGDAQDVVVADLARGSSYVFAITAFDAEGAYDPVFERHKNVLLFLPSLAAFWLPRLQVESEIFAGGTLQPPIRAYNPDPAKDVVIEVPADAPTRFRWSAEAPCYADLLGYRWALDPDSIDGGPLRPGHARGNARHWTGVSLANTSTTIGPFHGPDARRDHRLFIEAHTEFGYKTLIVLRLRPARARFDRDLLIVDDTRLPPVAPPPFGAPLPGKWPSAAELDTFLFARGGVPWRLYPPGTLSTPGLFSGYSFDTLGTRTGMPQLTVPLEILSRYRHVIWIVDPIGASYTRSGSDPRQPTTALRYMSDMNRVNTLNGYVRQGGKLWLLGGGAALANLEEWNYPGNDGPTPLICSEPPEGGWREFGPGHLMYDDAGWRSCITNATEYLDLVRADQAPPGFPARLQRKTGATDVLPPLRAPLDVFHGKVTVEYLSAPNAIAADLRPPRRGDPLDSLYAVQGPGLPAPPAANVCMTIHRTESGGEVVFSGFDLWSFRRSQCRALVDAILRDRWGIGATVSARR